MPTTELAQQTRETILRDLAHGPKTVWEIVSKHYPKAVRESSDPDYSRFVRLAAALDKEGKIKRVDPKNRMSAWTLRSKPHVDDLPDAAPAKRGYTKRAHQNGATSSAVEGIRAYLIRNIRTQLDELEKLG